MSFVFIILSLYGGFFLFLVFTERSSYKNRSSERKRRINFTVVIPFRNEERNLSSLVKCIKTLDYKNGEVEFLFINDHSKDNGKKLLQQEIEKINQWSLRIMDLKDIQGKKQAIKYGISQAQFEYIVQIDADVTFGKNYLDSVAGLFFEENVHLVLGSVEMNGNGNLLSRLQQAEFISIMAMTYYTTTSGISILANGANMAYTKELFNVAESARNDYQLSSGDDVFLLYAAKKMKEMQIVFNRKEDGQVYIQSKNRLKSFIDQRIRWAQKSRHYKDNDARIIGILIILMNIIMLILMLLFVFQEIEWISFLMLFLMKWSMDVLFTLSYNAKIKRAQFIFNSLLLSLFYPIYTNSIALLSLLYRPSWKGRKIQ